jgi:hypothetical protein
VNFIDFATANQPVVVQNPVLRLSQLQWSSTSNDLLLLPETNFGLGPGQYPYNPKDTKPW